MIATARRLSAVSFLVSLLTLPARIFAFCHELDVVQGRVIHTAANTAPAVTIQWLGHSTFQITSSKGTRVLTDPHGAFDLPRPTLPQHIVTTSHQHGPHNSVHMASGTPVILHGLSPSGEDWQKISTTIRDVSVYDVPAYHDKSRGMQRGNNAIFVFRVDDICIAHLGDLGHVPTPEQLKMIGKIDILLVPIAGGYFTVTPTEAREVTKLVNPKIAIPMHFWWEEAVREYTQGLTRVKMLSAPVLKISKAELPQPIETVVMPWGQR
ncbi:MAG TPA: MBL fold metallo-hydrolase [Candidatus Limnocylindrales bacterium]|nr:MBL fold metallo-hydrolase [Candidatus Limnocylindrales bacterium]